MQEAPTVPQETHRLIFIGGVHGRTGTSVVKRLLCTHPEVSAVSGGETRMLEAVEDLWPMLIADAGYTPGGASQAMSVFARHVRATLGESPAMQAALERLHEGVGARSVRLIGRARSPMPAPMREKDLSRVLGAFITDAFRLAALDPSRPVLCEKTPSNAQYIRRLQLLLPEARVALMVRDPMAVALSHTQREWGPTDPVEAAAYTAAYFRCWRGFAPHAQNCLVVRHEDLVGDPGHTLETVVRFLGLRQDATWLGHASAQIHPSQDRVHALPGVVATQMRALLADELNQWGYSLLSGAR